MKNVSSLTKMFLKWTSIGLLVFVSIMVVVAYISVEFYLQSSYRNNASNNYRQAALDSSRAVKIANWLYPGTSKHLQAVHLYDIKLWSKFGILGTSFGEGYDNHTVGKTVLFENDHSDELTPEDFARMRIDGARIANATTHGEGVAALVYGIVKGSRPSNAALMAYAKEENAYQDVVGIFATLKPTDMKDKILNNSIVEMANNDHDTAQETICKTDVTRCRFNQLRWQIGLCIRRAYLNETPVCAAEVLREVTLFPDACGKELTIDQCYNVMNDLLPHYHHLMQAQGNKIIATHLLDTNETK